MEKLSERQLKKGLELFWTKGFDAVAPKDAEEFMGLEPGSFDALCGTKADLYVRLLEFYFEHYWRKALEGLMREQPLSRALTGFFEDEVRICLEKSAPCGNILVVRTGGIVPEAAEAENVRTGFLREIEKSLFNRLEAERRQGRLGADAADISDKLSRAYVRIAEEARKGAEKKTLTELAESAVLMVPIL
jgi:AcrR family transcriptional regulator